jgi:hypothetical protein
VVIRYREINGRVERDIVHTRELPRSRGEAPPDRHFSQTILKAYYDLECQQGARFRCGLRKSVIKKAHETAIQRFEQTGETS